MKNVEVDSYGFPRGAGIFETIKTVEGKPIALGRHMRRALESANALGFSLPTEDSIRSEIIEVLSSHPHPIGRLRLTFSPELFHASHNEYCESDAPARVNFFSQSVEGSIHKCFPYDDRFAILERAREEAFDDSILFNRKNEITESAISNLVFLIEGQWVTPPITSGILPGVMRAIAIEECGVKVETIHISQIPEIESGFLLSSLKIAQPISHIGDMVLKIGEPSHQLESEIRAHALPVSVG